MKSLLLFTIKVYWAAFPESKRRKCIFRISCSQHVYQSTKKEGFYKGIIALKYRYLNCRSGFQIFNHPIDGSKMIMLPSGQVLTEGEISERFIKA